MRSTARKESFLIARLIRKPDFPKSSWHGWTLHVVSVVAAIWFPLAAVLTPANVALSPPATALLREVSAQVRFVLGDRHYNTPELHENCDQADRLKVPTRYGRYPHTDDGVEVRRSFHKLRSIAMENFNELIFGIFDGHGQVPDLWLNRHPTLCVRGHLCLLTRLDFPALSTTWNFASDSKLFGSAA